MTALAGEVYQSVAGFEDHLYRELGSRHIETWGPFVYAGTADPAPIPARPDTAAPPVFWCRNRWLHPFRVEFSSISEAANRLMSIQRNWAASFFTNFRRGALIEAQVPPVSQKPRAFPWLLPQAPMGAWTLLDAHTLLASPDCSSPFPAGRIIFAEDREGPPSRAYLKLWEALTRCRKWPGPGERCLDAGASPGGWTWALARLGAEVTAVDRAPLEPRIAALPGVSFVKHDAFTLKPEDLGPLDWLFCDAACYPSRLYEWVERWLASGLCANFVCTIKMQGAVGGAAEPDFDTPRRFAAIPGSTVVHLWHNKHELTWIKTG
ncbi:MAG: hypothetical protein LBL43_06930 [Treponema sp.]|jgi:23S rRNA (cytidine2498-2'-O)-methyltransferase|nr:hypothetical protein [Treponema sp.]